MPTFGRTLLGTTGFDIMLSADGKPDYKAAGVTLDWSTVAPVSGSPVTTPDNVIVAIGNSYLRYGQVIAKITNQSVQVVTVNGTPTGGTFTLSGVSPENGNPFTTAPLAYNASAATVLAALQTSLGVLNVVSVTGSAGGPYTVTFNAGIQTLTTNGAGLTGGTSPTVTVAVTTPGLNYGKFGPYDPAATDGRQTLTRGNCFLLNTSVYLNMPFGIGVTDADNPSAIEGGLVWLDRCLQSGVAAHSLALGPTFAELLAAFPRLRFAEN